MKFINSSLILLIDQIKPFFYNSSINNIFYLFSSLDEALKLNHHQNYKGIGTSVSNKSCKQDHTKQKLYGHLLPITPTIQIRLARYAGHCWRSKDKFTYVDIPLLTDQQKLVQKLEAV